MSSQVNCERPRRAPALGVRREKAALPCGLKPHPAQAPAGSNASGPGGNKMAEAFGYAWHLAKSRLSLLLTTFGLRYMFAAE